jgi:hypothetical protein
VAFGAAAAFGFAFAAGLAFAFAAAFGFAFAAAFALLFAAGLAFAFAAGLVFAGAFGFGVAAGDDAVLEALCVDAGEAARLLLRRAGRVRGRLVRTSRSFDLSAMSASSQFEELRVRAETCDTSLRSTYRSARTGSAR